YRRWVCGSEFGGVPVRPHFEQAPRLDLDLLDIIELGQGRQLLKSQVMQAHYFFSLGVGHTGSFFFASARSLVASLLAARRASASSSVFRAAAYRSCASASGVAVPASVNGTAGRSPTSSTNCMWNPRRPARFGCTPSTSLIRIE